MRRFRAVTAVAAGVLVLALAGCGGDNGDGNGEAEEAAADEVTVTLEEVEGSGQTGTATLTATGSKTHVFIIIDGEAISEGQPAHIHEGTCENLTPEPAYGLESVVTSISETTVDVPLATLTAGEYAINLHRSPADLETYTSCGNITR
jgi:hypothetical protein